MNTTAQLSMQDMPFSLDLTPLTAIKKQRNNPIIVIAASVLDMEALPQLFNLLDSMLPEDKTRLPELDVLLYGRGGEVVAARRFGILLHKFCEKLNFIVPFHCQSTMTILTLAGHHIIAGDMALFSPIDPCLNCDDHGSLASEDIRLFSEMGKQWFGIDSEDSKTELLSAIAGSVFPTTLTGLYRANQEVFQVAGDLLGMGSPDLAEGTRRSIVEHLVHGYHSHNFAPTNDDFQALGLPISRQHNVESLAWQLAQSIQAIHGGGARKSPQDPNNDFIIASETQCRVRQRIPGAMAPVWTLFTEQ